MDTGNYIERKIEEKAEKTGQRSGAFWASLIRYAREEQGWGRLSPSKRRVHAITFLVKYFNNTNALKATTKRILLNVFHNIICLFIL